MSKLHILVVAVTLALVPAVTAAGPAENPAAILFSESLGLKTDSSNADGIVRGWFDGKLVIDRTNVVLRSTDFPKMNFNQFLLTPYFGPGLLPHEQMLWIDELAVGTKRLGPVAAR